MVLGKLFNKKEENNDIALLKQKFAYLTTQQSMSQQIDNTQNNIPSSQMMQQNAFPPGVNMHPGTMQQNPHLPNGMMPTSIPGQGNVQDNPDAISLVETISGNEQEVELGNTYVNNTMNASEALAQNQMNPDEAIEMPSWAVEGQQEVAEAPKENKVQETVDDIQEKFYDAKLNSLLIDQVKELVEIDNNLNAKIDDVTSELHQEVKDREEINKKMDKLDDRLKSLEKSVDKFIGLYEVITNQFNPFIDKAADPEVNKFFKDEQEVSAVELAKGNKEIPPLHHETLGLRQEKSPEELKKLEAIKNLPPIKLGPTNKQLEEQGMSSDVNSFFSDATHSNMAVTNPNVGNNQNSNNPNFSNQIPNNQNLNNQFGMSNSNGNVNPNRNQDINSVNTIPNQGMNFNGNSNNQANSFVGGYCPVHEKIHPSLHFELNNGEKLTSIYDLLAVLDHMDSKTFSHHVSLKHNDFSLWIDKVLQLRELANQVELIKTQVEMAQTIRNFLANN